MKEDSNISFADKVYALCKKIPKGRVSTYKDIGNALGGYGQVYRAVGVALNRNSHAPIVPCHRVVNSNGNVGGFAHGTKNKIKLLKAEGIQVVNGKIKEFKKVFFIITTSK
ncbi:Methylated-DNA--protein-cysteine methyltransferase [uncultured archaeon]|nr:Methylated-DNA--protein-cysteine methyltransferase [uncultured archaeon]